MWERVFSLKTTSKDDRVRINSIKLRSMRLLYRDPYYLIVDRICSYDFTALLLRRVLAACPFI